MKKHYPVIIMGSGPAGLTAALYTARAELNPLVITGMPLGGQLLKTSSVCNWPGIEEIEGPLLIEELRLHAARSGAQFEHDRVTSVTLTETEKTLTLSSGTILTTTSLIVACGTTPKPLGCPGEEQYKNNGVYTQLESTEHLYRDLPVAVVGGGNSAIYFASRLLHAGAHVTLVHNLDRITAQDPLVHAVMEHPRLQVLYNSTVAAVYGAGSQLTHAAVKNAHHEELTHLPLAALFLALGSAPNTELFVGQLDLLGSGHIAVTPGTSLTSVPGVFAAGDVCDNRYRHAITSAGQGCMAALDAEKYMNGKVVIRFYKK